MTSEDDRDQLTIPERNRRSFLGYLGGGMQSGINLALL
jgi:hypothetical protein